MDPDWLTGSHVAQIGLRLATQPEHDLRILIILPLPLQRKNEQRSPPYLVYLMLGKEFRASSMLGKHPANRVIAPALIFLMPFKEPEAHLPHFPGGPDAEKEVGMKRIQY